MALHQLSADDATRRENEILDSTQGIQSLIPLLFDCIFRWRFGKLFHERSGRL